MRLSKEGYGSINEIKHLDVKTFLDLVHYEEYVDKYSKAFRALNEKCTPRQ